MCVCVQIIAPFNIYFNARLIFQKLELWRLLTNFCFFGSLGKGGMVDHAVSSFLCPRAALHLLHLLRTVCHAGLDFVFHMFFLIKYSKALEEGSFRSKSADFLWMLLFGEQPRSLHSNDGFAKC